MNDQQPYPGEGVIHHPEGMDLLPSSIALAGTEVALVNAMNRESMLKYVLNEYRKDYDHILIDCMPSLGMLTINALAASNKVIVPVPKAPPDDRRQIGSKCPQGGRYRQRCRRFQSGA